MLVTVLLEPQATVATCPRFRFFVLKKFKRKTSESTLQLQASSWHHALTSTQGTEVHANQKLGGGTEGLSSDGRPRSWFHPDLRGSGGRGWSPRPRPCHAPIPKGGPRNLVPTE